MSQPTTGLCFIATAIDGKYRQEPLESFLRFRDQVLTTNFLGKLLIRAYYSASPYAAKYVTHSPFAKKIAKYLLMNIAKVVYIRKFL